MMDFSSFIVTKFVLDTWRYKYTFYKNINTNNILKIALCAFIFTYVIPIHNWLVYHIISVQFYLNFHLRKLKITSLMTYVIFKNKSFNYFERRLCSYSDKSEGTDRSNSISNNQPKGKPKGKIKVRKSNVIKRSTLELNDWQKTIGIKLLSLKNGNQIFPKGLIALSEKDVDVLAGVLETRIPVKFKCHYDIVLIKTAIIENIKFFNELVINNNVTKGPSIYKSTWTSVLTNFRGGDFEQVKGVSYSQFNRIPSKLNSLNKFYLLIKTQGINSDTLFVFHLLESLYSIYKLPTEIPELNLNSITDKLTKDQYDYVNSMSKSFRSFLKENPVSKDIAFQWEKELGNLSRQYKITNKSGPNGKATKTMILDAYVLKHNVPLFNNYKKMCKHLDCEYLVKSVEHYSNLYELNNNSVSSKVSIIAKVTQVPEKGNKNRVVAIQNFWVQQPMNLLRQLIDKTITKHYINNDACFMYNHFGSLLKAIKSYKDTGFSVSFDLTNATDRIPRIYQRDVLSAYVNPRFAQDYFEMVSLIDFTTKNGDVINYEVGQPMGSYESFNLFQAFLLELWRFSAYKTGKSFKVEEVCKYFSTVGDDNQGFDPELAEYWRGFLENSGCEISKTKTIGKINGVQWFTTCSLLGAVDEDGNSVNLSPISVSLLNNAVDDFREIPYFINDLVSRGYTLDNIRPLFQEGGCFYKQLSRSNKENITYLQLLSEYAYCTFDGTRHIVELLSDQPNRLKDLNLTPNMIDDLKIIYLLIRAVELVRNKMTDIETKYLRMFPNFDANGNDINKWYAKLRAINGIDLKNLYPGNIPKEFIPEFTVIEDVQSEFINELIVIQSLNIVKTISDIGMNWNKGSIENTIDIEKITTMITSLDTEFKVILSRKESNHRFNTYPLHNKIINGSIKVDADVIADVPIVIENSTDVQSNISFYVSDSLLNININTKNPFLFRLINLSKGIFNHVNLSIELDL